MEPGTEVKLTILGCGTSTGVPVPGCNCRVCSSTNPKNHRLRTSALLTMEDQSNILIDAGPDLRAQALRARVKSLAAVLFTHTHADHIMGIDDLRPFNFVRRGAIPAYGSEVTVQEITRIFRYIFVPDPDYEGGALPKIDLTSFEEGKAFHLLGREVLPFLLMHGRSKVTGFRFGDLVYATDCKTIPTASREIMRGAKYLILDGLRNEPHLTHLTIPEAVNLASELGFEQTYLTHLTHTVDYELTNATLPKHVQLAYDGLELKFDWPRRSAN